MDWQSYEDVVKYIYENLGKSSRVKILGHGPSCKLRGKSSVEHQIDVLTEHSDGIHTYKTAIECKHWAAKIQKDTVTKLAEILEDAQIQKGVIVAKAGFTEDAIAFAQYKDISLVELREPTQADWEGRIKDIVVNLHVLSPQIKNFQFVWTAPSSSSQDVTAQSVISSDIFFCMPQGEKSVATIIQDEMKSSTWAKQEVTPCVVNFPNRTTLKIKGFDKTPPVSGVKFEIHRVIHELKIEIRGNDYVAMIMHCLFEDKRFVIGKKGQIRETRT